MIVDPILHWAKKKPEKVALEYLDQKVTFGNFAKAIMSAYNFLSTKDLKENDVVIVAIHSPVVAWIILFACKMLGLNTLVITAPTKDLVASFTKIDCVITYSDEGTLGRNEHLKPFPYIMMPGTLFRNEIIRQIKLPIKLERLPTCGGTIVLTSGSTGEAKKVLYGQKNEIDFLLEKAKLRKINPGTILLIPGYALHSGSGYLDPCYSWIKGGRVILSEPYSWTNDFFDKNPTQVLLRPSLLELLKNNYALKTKTNTRPIEVILGGGFYPAQNVDWALSHLTSKLFIAYGTTETAHFCISPFQGAEDLKWHKPLKGKGYIIKDDNGKEAPIGSSGRIGIANTPTSICSNYFDMNNETEQARFSDGYFFPGDYAVAREDGRFRLLGRQTDGVILKEQVIPSRLIEEDLEKNLNVTSVLVFSHQNDDLEDEVVVVVETDKPLNAFQEKFIRAKFADITSVKIVLLNAFPVSDAGKTDRIRIVAETRAKL